MAAITPTSPDILPDIPDPDTIRRRLAGVTTEANLLRSQLRVSKRPPGAWEQLFRERGFIE
jgi:hypothetical protein